MPSQKITYAGVVGAVAGIVGVFGIYAGWFADGAGSLDGTVDVSGKLGLAFAIATFAFGGAYILLSDPGIRRAMGALMTISAVLLTISTIWAVTRAADVADGTSTGLLVSGMGGLLGICAGFLALQASMDADETASGAFAPDAGDEVPASTSAD